MRGAREHRSCRLFQFLVSFSVPLVANFEQEAQVRSHLVEAHVSSDECSSLAKCCRCLFVCRMCRMLRVRCVLGNGRISLVAKMCFSKHKKLLLMCGLVEQVCFRVRVFFAASEEL